MRCVMWISLFAIATQLSGQSAIPAGTMLPVQLNSSINSRKVKPGQVITARVMEDVPLSPRSRIDAGAKVIGRVVSVEPGKVSIRFDTLIVSKRQVPLTINLRALASMMEVEGAKIPIMGADRGTPEDIWVRQRVGEESNPLLLGLTGNVRTKCREVEDDSPREIWVFSSNACGVYGFDDLQITHAGRSEPAGEIRLASERGDVNVGAGSGMLLRVD